MPARHATAMLLLATTPAVAQPAAQPRASLQDCSVVASEGLGGREAASSIGLAFSGDGPERHVVAAAPRAAQAPAPEAELRPIRPGVSYGATLSQPPGDAQEAAFTMATIEEAGTVLLETWRWRAMGAATAPPAYAWSRLRCGP
jgi:hypothetical protein